MFNIDWNKLITWMLPVGLRKTIFYAWVKVLCQGVVSLYGEFMAKRSADLYNLAHDSRVFSIQAVLNDVFDNTLRRIYITDGQTNTFVPIYTIAENKPLYLNVNTTLYTTGETINGGVDFIVWIPGSIVISAFNATRLNGLIAYYKLPSKKYLIFSF